MRLNMLVGSRSFATVFKYTEIFNLYSSGLSVKTG
jgi:hypothetical protein